MAQPLWLPQLLYNQRLSANVHVSALCGREHYILDYQNCTSTYLFDTQVIQVTRVSIAGKGRFDKKKQKNCQAYPLHFMTMATSMTLVTGVGSTIHKMIF